MNSTDAFKKLVRYVTKSKKVQEMVVVQGTGGISFFSPLRGGFVQLEMARISRPSWRDVATFAHELGHSETISKNNMRGGLVWERNREYREDRYILELKANQRGLEILKKLRVPIIRPIAKYMAEIEESYRSVLNSKPKGNK